MDTYWKIDTRGDPLGALLTFLQTLWEQSDVKAFVVPPQGNGHLLESADELVGVNPFRPVMKLNTAMLVVQAARERPGQRIGALLRPCELRALNQMAARGALRREQVLVVCVDCLGTFPAEEYRWRSERSPSGLTRETLRFAPQGGISAYRYRPACQMCSEPGAREADVNVGVFGLPVRNCLLVSARDGDLVMRAITSGPADADLVSRREQMLAKIAERHARTRERVLRGLAQDLPSDLNALMAQMEACGECQSCMDVCPICAVDRPRKERDGGFVRQDVLNWLVSCAGCGMCEQACPQHQPLSAIFSHLRARIESELAV